MSQTVRLGVFGLGTVGSGLVNIIRKRNAHLKDRYGIELEVSRAVVQNLSRKRSCETDGIRIGTDYAEILEADDVDIVVELIGGTDDAAHIVLSALEAGKPVVSANKALLAERGPEIMALAHKKRTPFFAEASVGGGIPILKTLRESLVANRIDSLTAIINGTTNFVLTKMEEEGLSYYEALKLAGEMGFAEADPTFDVEGIDARQKLLILAAHIYGGVFPEGEILCEGITRLTESDFRFARKYDMTVKLLAIARRLEDGIELRVHPTLISKRHPLAGVRNEFNAVFLNGDAVGEVMLSGRGAGSLPTASAVYADVVDICTRKAAGDPPESHRKSPAIVPPDRISSEYYLSFTIEDKPGVIGEIATTLGAHGVSVSSVSAELIPNVPDLGEVEIIVHKTTEAQIRQAVQAIGDLSRIRGKGKYIRIEGGLNAK